MKKLFFLLCTFPLFWACEGMEVGPDVPDLPGQPQEVEKAPLTILAYLIANNNLDDFLSYNIGIMYDGLAAMDKPATLLIYWDGKTTIGANNGTHLILKYETDGEGNVNGLPKVDTSSSLTEVLEIGEIVKEYPGQLSTSSTVMTSVLNDMLEKSPTERVGLIFGSHGSAWLNTIYTRAFGQDGSGTDNTIRIPDMVSALKSTNRTFDFILFDACYMGTAEVCYDFRDVADYQIVSAMEVPAYGFPYDMFMADLYEGTPDGYQKACETYFDYYNQLYIEGSSNTWGTVALVDSKEMQAMATVLKEEIVSHQDELANYDATVLQEYGRSSGRYISFDMGQLVKDLNGGSIPDKFQTQLDKTIVYKECMEKANPSSYSVDASNFCGLGMYVPVKTKTAWNDYFKTTDWYSVAGWNEVTFSWNF